MKANIATIAGDGIGPEIMEAALTVLAAVNKKFKHEITPTVCLAGGQAYERYGKQLPEETVKVCRESQAILFGAVGGPVGSLNDPRWKDVEKTVILGLRKKFDLFANLRPIKMRAGLEGASPLKAELVHDLDLLIVRELVSGIYFGPRRRYRQHGESVAEDTNLYRYGEIERVLRVAFEAAAGTRRKKLTLVDKANVLDTSRLWREVAEKIWPEYREVSLDYMFVDNAAMQLCRQPSAFDVIVTENMFGDILSDLGGAIVGSIGLLPSASLNAKKFGLFEPIHGSAPDIAGKNIANPTAQILSLAMLFEHSLGLYAEARAIEAAVEEARQNGCRTADLAREGESFLTTQEFARAVADRINI